MTTGIKKYRYTIARRVVQIGLLLLFVGANFWGWTVLKGNYSSAVLFDSVPLSDPYALLQILASGFLTSSKVFIGAAVVIVLYGLLLGRVFCAWVCPVNLLEDLATWLNKKLGLFYSFKLSRKLRYWIMGVGIIVSVVIGFAAFEAVSPIGMLHRSLVFGVGGSWAVLIALFLFDLVGSKRAWCGHLCPLGAFYATVGKFARLKVHYDNAKCTKCMKCFAVCPEKQVLSIVTKQSGVIKPSECTNCGRCVEVCDDTALLFSLKSERKELNKK